MSNTNDIDTLARTLFGEARGEGEDGMTAVACVVMNRCAAAKEYIARRNKPHTLFGDGTPASACKRPWQFSCWNTTDPNRAVIEHVTEADRKFSLACHIAQQAVEGKLNDVTGGATHYHDRRMPMEPFWARGKKPCAAIGHHLFYRDVA